MKKLYTSGQGFTLHRKSHTRNKTRQYKANRYKEKSGNDSMLVPAKVHQCNPPKSPKGLNPKRCRRSTTPTIN